jgi:hypothetical protein
MRKLSTRYWNFCHRILYIDILILVILFGGGGFVACSNQVEAQREPLPEIEYLEEYRLGSSGKISTFKLNGYCYMVVDIARGAGLGSGLTKIDCRKH